VKAYYERDGITIYHGDCREMIGSLDANVVVTDPPYGINAAAGGRTFGTSNACSTNEYRPIHGDDRPFDPSPFLGYLMTILWGANHYAHLLPASPSWLVWDKRDALNPNPLADCELAWTNVGGPARLFHHRWMGMIRDSERETRWHPAQKPVALMSWCISMTAGTILDPFMGSGPVLVAALRSGRRAIGIEIEERYCEIAAKRLQQRAMFPAASIGASPCES